MIISEVLMISLILLVIGLVLAFFRFLLGPSITDRIVALDMIAILMGGITGIYMVMTGQDVFLDVLGTLALISFISTVAFARYLEKRVCQ